MRLLVVLAVVMFAANGLAKKCDTFPSFSSPQAKAEWTVDRAVRGQDVRKITNHKETAIVLETDKDNAGGPMIKVVRRDNGVEEWWKAIDSELVPMHLGYFFDDTEKYGEYVYNNVLCDMRAESRKSMRVGKAVRRHRSRGKPLITVKYGWADNDIEAAHFWTLKLDD